MDVNFFHVLEGEYKTVSLIKYFDVAEHLLFPYNAWT